MISCIFVFQLISSFIALRLGCVPYIVSVFILCSHFLMFLSYLYYAHKLCDVSYKEFFNKVLLPCGIILVLSLALPWAFASFSKDVLSALVHIVLSVVWVALIVWFLGVTKGERLVLKRFIYNKTHKIKH